MNSQDNLQTNSRLELVIFTAEFTLSSQIIFITSAGVFTITVFLLLPLSLSLSLSLSQMGAYSRPRFAAQVQCLRFLSSFCATCTGSDQPVRTWLARRRNAIGCLRQLLCPSASSTRDPTVAILQR